MSIPVLVINSYFVVLKEHVLSTGRLENLRVSYCCANDSVYSAIVFDCC
jgi:hypothetical protein